jgi:hypothetical protein
VTTSCNVAVCPKLGEAAERKAKNRKTSLKPIHLLGIMALEDPSIELSSHRFNMKIP